VSIKSGTLHSDAEQLAGQVEQLRIADDARSLLLIETAVTRDKAETARVALGMRGLDLDHPGDRVTAQEWIDADTTAKLAADAERVITEHDFAATAEPVVGDLPVDELPEVAEPAAAAGAVHETTRDDGAEEVPVLDRPPAPVEEEADHQPVAEPAEELPLDDEPDRTAVPVDQAPSDDLPVPDEPVRDEPPAPAGDMPMAEPLEVKLAPVDIRETAVPEVSERADPAERRRVPAPDRTTADVARARLAVAEIEQRRTAEAAQHTAREAQPVDDEDVRRADLARRVEPTDTTKDDMTHER